MLWISSMLYPRSCFFRYTFTRFKYVWFCFVRFRVQERNIMRKREIQNSFVINWLEMEAILNNFWTCDEHTNTWLEYSPPQNQPTPCTLAFMVIKMEHTEAGKKHSERVSCPGLAITSPKHWKFYSCHTFSNSFVLSIIIINTGIGPS